MVSLSHGETAPFWVTPQITIAELNTDVGRTYMRGRGAMDIVELHKFPLSICG